MKYNRFTYILEFGPNQKVNLSLFLQTQNEFQIMKQIIKGNVNPFPKRKIVSVLNTEVKG